MYPNMFSENNLIQKRYIRASSPDILASRIDHLREDILRGKEYEESTVSILARAIAVTTGEGFVISSTFKRDT